MEFEEPTDHIIPEEGYVRQFGDPDMNGKGHRRVSTPGLERGVAMPGPRVRKARRKHGKPTSLDTRVMTSDDPLLGDDQLRTNLRAFEHPVFGVRAAGQAVTMDMLLGNYPGSWFQYRWRLVYHDDAARIGCRPGH